MYNVYIQVTCRQTKLDPSFLHFLSFYTYACKERSNFQLPLYFHLQYTLLMRYRRLLYPLKTQKKCSSGKQRVAVNRRKFKDSEFYNDCELYVEGRYLASTTSFTFSLTFCVRFEDSLIQSFAIKIGNKPYTHFKRHYF